MPDLTRARGADHERCFAARGVEVVLARLDEGEEEVKALAQRLSPAERERACRFRFERDRRRFIVARARLRELLAGRLDAAPESMELMYGKNGKPALAPSLSAARWRFNVSHCGDVALYAFSQEQEVGVDIEAVRWMPEADDIAAQCFTPGENERYRALPPEEKPLAFFTCWTRKEAFVKALGAGFSLRLRELDVSNARIDTFFPIPGFVAALATDDG